jgi:hypothetical protein
LRLVPGASGARWARAPRALAGWYATLEMATDVRGVRLSLDLDDPQGIPYFLWDEPMTLSELQARLQSANQAERLRLLGRILREARDTDVWRFTTPAEVVASWPQLQRYLGRRRAFWQFLLERWRDLRLDGRS